MPRFDGFGRTLWFAVLAAGFLPVAVTFGGPLVGTAGSVQLYLIAIAGLYTAGLAETRSRRVAALGMATGAGLVLSLLPIGLAGTAFGAAAIVAVGRSAITWRQRPLRAFAIEAVLGGAGLGVAGFLASGGMLALCLAVWGYFLVQSGYFLIGGRTARRDHPHRDPFERARVHLQRLIEEGSDLPR